MLIELGPFPADDVRRWIRFARRLICEVRVNPGDLESIATDDLLTAWTRYYDSWDDAARAGGDVFRWSGPVDVEMAEYLLHGFERSMRSSAVRDRMTREDVDQYGPFSLHVIQAFVDGLEAEGRSGSHYADQMRVSLGARLDH